MARRSKSRKPTESDSCRLGISLSLDVEAGDLAAEAEEIANLLILCLGRDVLHVDGGGRHLEMFQMSYMCWIGSVQGVTVLKSGVIKFREVCKVQWLVLRGGLSQARQGLIGPGTETDRCAMVCTAVSLASSSKVLASRRCAVGFGAANTWWREARIEGQTGDVILVL